MGSAADDISTEIPVTSEKGGKHQKYVPQKCFNHARTGYGIIFILIIGGES